jgi:hypothetical protein
MRTVYAVNVTDGISPYVLRMNMAVRQRSADATREPDAGQPMARLRAA